jgi:hypothetical protein
MFQKYYEWKCRKPDFLNIKNKFADEKKVPDNSFQLLADPEL